jgi:hypothetical protein
MSEAIKKELVERLAADHPEIYRAVDDERELITGKDRSALLEEWADNMIVDGFARIRRERNALLAASDWTQVADAPVDNAAWAKYRQALRDLPAKIKDPTANVKWPKAPE